MEIRISKDIFSLMFTESLFTVAKTWKKSHKYPLANEWILKMWYLYTLG
jgi:hypothetical protein